MMQNTSMRLLPTMALGLISMLIGCDRLPDTTWNRTNNVPADALSSAGRGGYDWRLSADRGALGLEILRPTSFKFVHELDDDLIRENYSRLKYVEEQGKTKPEWMDDDIYQWVRRFTEPHPEPAVVLDVPTNDEVGKYAFAVSPDGQRMVTVGTKLIEWEIETGKRLHEFPAPLEHCRQVAYGHDAAHVLVSNQRSLTRVQLDDGRAIATWQSPSNDLQGFVAASKADVVVALTGDMRMICLRDDFQTELRYQGERLISNSVAIDAAGRWILGATEGQLIRWHPGRSGKQVEAWDDKLLDDKVIGVCVKGFDRWINSHGFRQLEQGKQSLTERGQRNITTLNTFPWFAAGGSMPGIEDWLVVFSDRRRFDGTTERYVQDFTFRRASVPWRIPVDDIQAVSGDASMQTIAFRTPTAIKVYHRRAWVDADGNIVAEPIVNLIEQGRCEQLDKILDYFLAQPVVRGNYPGQHYYIKLLDAVGKAWARVEANPTSEDIQRKIQQWHQQGSLQARLCSAAKNMEVGATARGDGPANTVSQEAWGILKERNSLCMQELQPIIDGPNPPSAALFTMAQALRFAERPLAEQESVLKKSVELYPDEHLIYCTMCYTLAPRWGGQVGEGGAYVAAAAAHYPEPYSDVIYARAALYIIQRFGREGLMELGLNEQRAARAAEALLDSQRLHYTELECLMEIVSNVGDQALLEKLGRYHLETYSWISAYAVRKGPDILHQLRKELR